MNPSHPNDIKNTHNLNNDRHDVIFFIKLVRICLRMRYKFHVVRLIGFEIKDNVIAENVNTNQINVQRICVKFRLRNE